MNRPSDDLFSNWFEQDDDPLVAVAERPDPQAQDTDKPVVVTGAAGLVGARTCAVLSDRGWKVRAIVRNPAKAAERLGQLRIEIRSGDVRDPEFMRGALRGADAIVHLAAIAIEKRGETYQETNAQATETLLDACRTESVTRIVYMSQNGADSSSRFAFLRSKGIAEDAVKASMLRWTVLRPSVIFGPNDEFVNVLARLVRLSPIIYPLPGGGTARFQPIAVGDVARSVATCLEDDTTVGRSFSIGGPAPLTLRQMTERILVAMKASRIPVGVPVSVLRPIVALMQNLLPHPPVTTGLLDLLEVDNAVSPNDLVSELGIRPVPFAPEELLYLRKITFTSAIRSLLR